MEEDSNITLKNVPNPDDDDSLLMEKVIEQVYKINENKMNHYAIQNDIDINAANGRREVISQCYRMTLFLTYFRNLDSENLDECIELMTKLNDGNPLEFVNTEQMCIEITQDFVKVYNLLKDSF